MESPAAHERMAPSSARFRERPDGAPLASLRPWPRSLPSLCPRAERKASNKMKWIEKLLDRRPQTETKPEPKAETRPETLRIQELETRIAPNAVWGE